VRTLYILSLVLIILSGCRPKAESKSTEQSADSAETPAEAPAPITFGAPPAESAGLPADEALEVFGRLGKGDTLQTAFRAEVVEVCQAKGCWMRLALPEDQQVMVRFRDYGFFVPKDLAGNTVLVEGLAFISEVSEEERRHLAEDAGLSGEALAAVKGPAREYGFEATGVRLQAE
jgi:hypothetical protein